MNYLIPAGHSNLAELEPMRLQRDIPQSTSLEGVIAGIYRQRWLMAAVFAACLILGLVITLNSPPKYTAVASVQLEQQAPRVIADPDLDPQPSAQESERFLQTQLDRIRSRGIAEAVVTRLKLDKSPAYLAALEVSQDDPATTRARAIAKLQKDMKAELGLNTRLARISFTSLDPTVSARIANAFADALMAANVDSKLQTSLKAKQFLLKQLADAKGRLEGSERRMLAYARAADLTTTVVANSGDEDRGGSLRAQQLGLMTDSLAQATARRIDAQQNWAQVSGTSPMMLPDVQNNQAIQNLVAQKAQLEAALQEEKQRHTDEYPSVRETAAKIQELNGQIGRLASNVQTSFLGRYRAASQQEAQLAGTVGALRGAAMAERERAVGYNSLKREVETSKAFYDGLLQRYKEVALALGAPSGNVTLVDRAAPPLQPSSPNVERNIALASLAGLILALMVGSLRERMHQVIRSTRDLEQDFNLPSLGVVPLITERKEPVPGLVDMTSAEAEAYHSVAVALDQAMEHITPRTVLVTSSVASEGKSTTALGLARSFTAMGRRVLLIDADLRRPSSAKSAGHEVGPGLSDALMGTTRKSLIRADEQGLRVMRAGDANANPVALLGSKRIKALLDQLSGDHDIIIVDGPPIMGLADAVLLAHNVSAIVVVVEANRVHPSELDLAVSRLPEGKIAGAVITKFDPRTAGVRYGGTDYYQY